MKTDYTSKINTLQNNLKEKDQFIANLEAKYSKDGVMSSDLKSKIEALEAEQQQWKLKELEMDKKLKLYEQDILYVTNPAI
jgi:hypothetical protein